jgi:hypothetical protein
VYNPGVYPVAAGPRTTGFIACEPARLRLVLQHASAPVDPSFTPDTSTIDTINVTRTTIGVERLAGFRESFAPAPSGFEWHHDTAGWGLPAGTSGSIGAPASSSIFRFTHTSASAPYWFVLVATAGIPVLRIGARYLVQHHRAKNAPLHPCPACGYDLRATPDRCPECGRVAMPPVA